MSGGFRPGDGPGPVTLRHDLDGFVLDAIGFDADRLDATLTWLNEPDSDWRDRFERRVERAEVLGALLCAGSAVARYILPIPPGEPRAHTLPRPLRFARGRAAGVGAGAGGPRLLRRDRWP